MLVLLTATWAGTAAAGPVRPAPTQELAGLLTAHEALAAPRAGSLPLELVPAQGPLTAERTVLPVLRHATSAAGVGWLQVRLPGRPNGHTGWIRQAGTVALTTSWHIVVDTSRRRVTVYDYGFAVRMFVAIVGKPSTPTPPGEFFVEEDIQLQPGDVGAPYALALSARSTVLQEFDGGPGQIALHGLLNVGGVLGSAVSHGCVRLDNTAMRWLVIRISPGIPVTITG
jgi:lipoprotein-anchoring transpeptidase ErfK/SrfK